MTAQFWRDCVARATRSCFDVLLPTLVLLTSTRQLRDVSGWIIPLLVLVAALLHALKSVLTLDVDVNAVHYAKAADQAAPAAAITVVGYVAANGSGLVQIDSRGLGILVAASFATAFAHHYLDPPTVATPNARSDVIDATPPG